MPDLGSIGVLSRSQWFLDISPMIDALRFQPADFEYTHGWLRHVPSRHRFCFDQYGGVTIDAACGCARQPIRQDQARQQFETFTEWRADYWRPLEVNREFASHFRYRGAWVRLFRDVKMALRRFRSRGEPTVCVSDDPSTLMPRRAASRRQARSSSMLSASRLG